MPRILGILKGGPSFCPEMASVAMSPGEPRHRSSMQTQPAAPLPSLSVRIDLDTEGRIGPGKIQLLEKIREFGSISAAGRAMDMSYKRACDFVDRIKPL